MNKGLNAVKNIFWLLTIIVAVVALLIGIVFSMSRKYYGDRIDGVLNLRGEHTVVSKPSAAPSQGGTPSLAELNSTQDAGIEYVFSLTYLCDSTIIGLNDYAAGFSSSAKASMWTDSGTGLPAAGASDAMIVSPSDGSQLTAANAAMVYQPKRLVVYIGGDSLASATEESFTAGYKKLIENIRAASPNTSIVCCSIASIATSYTGSDGLTAEQFANANKWIQSICRDTGVQFADLASVLNGDNGYMNIDYAANDGRSLNSAGISEVINYFRFHASI